MIFLSERLQRERYIRMLVADVQGPSISYWKGPMYVSICAPQLFGQGSLNFLAMPSCSIQCDREKQTVRRTLYSMTTQPWHGMAWSGMTSKGQDQTKFEPQRGHQNCRQQLQDINQTHCRSSALEVCLWFALPWLALPVLPSIS